VNEEREKLIELNEIFKELIQDASGLTEHLVYSIKQYMFSSVLMFLLAGLTLWTFWYVYSLNLFDPMYFFFSYGPVFIILEGSFIWLSAVAILNYRKLKKKYSRLFEIQKALEKEEK